MSGTSIIFGWIVANLSEADALALINAHAGRRLYVPSLSRGQESLTQVGLTEEGLRLLVTEFGGSYINVPMARSFRAEILRKQGLSYGKIAATLGCSESGLHKLFQRGGHRPASQLDLFPL